MPMNFVHSASSDGESVLEDWIPVYSRLDFFGGVNQNLKNDHLNKKVSKH